MKIINTLVWDALVSVIQKRFSIRADSHVIITFTSDEDSVRRFNVNWAALGSVDTREALKFVQQLSRAIKVANVLNGLNIKVDYSDYDDLASKYSFEDRENIADCFEEWLDGKRDFDSAAYENILVSRSGLVYTNNLGEFFTPNDDYTEFTNDRTGEIKSIINKSVEVAPAFTAAYKVR